MKLSVYSWPDDPRWAILVSYDGWNAILLRWDPSTAELAYAEQESRRLPADVANEVVHSLRWGRWAA